jgi:hypothetical protein
MQAVSHRLPILVLLVMLAISCGGQIARASHTDALGYLTRADVVAAFRTSGVDLRETSCSLPCYDGDMLSIGPFDVGFAAVSIEIFHDALAAESYTGTASWEGKPGARQRVFNVLVWTKPGLPSVGRQRIAKAIALLRRDVRR